MNIHAHLCSKPESVRFPVSSSHPHLVNSPVRQTSVGFIALSPQSCDPEPNITPSFGHHADRISNISPVSVNTLQRASTLVSLPVGLNSTAASLTPLTVEKLPERHLSTPFQPFVCAAHANGGLSSEINNGESRKSHHYRNTTSPDHSAHLNLFKDAVKTLSLILQNNHNDQRERISALQEALSNMVGSITSAEDSMKTEPSPAQQKKQKKECDIQFLVSAIHDNSKGITAVNMQKCEKGENIFHKTTTATQFAALILEVVKILENFDT